MELNEIVGGIMMGIGIAFVLVGLYIWILFQRIRSRVDDMVKQIIQEAESNLVGLDIELDRNTYFCYNSEDKQFVCQGATVAEIRTAFQSRYPGKTAYLAGGDPAVVEHFKTELLRLGTNDTGN
jgi:anionic cell wall polymer biosynthesis LytR-Cps2A-Psr (LCP) family protein